MALDTTNISPNTTFFTSPADARIKIYRPIGYKGVDYS